VLPRITSNVGRILSRPPSSRPTKPRHHQGPPDRQALTLSGKRGAETQRYPQQTPRLPVVTCASRHAAARTPTRSANVRGAHRVKTGLRRWAATTWPRRDAEDHTRDVGRILSGPPSTRSDRAAAPPAPNRSTGPDNIRQARGQTSTPHPTNSSLAGCYLCLCKRHGSPGSGGNDPSGSPRGKTGLRRRAATRRPRTRSRSWPVIPSRTPCHKGTAGSGNEPERSTPIRKHPCGR